MIDKGVNPFVVDHHGNTEYNQWSLSSEKLSNLPQIKSCYFPVKIFPGFPQVPWQYGNGVFPGQFDVVIGQGGEGTVIGGEMNGEPVAYKFVMWTASPCIKQKYIGKHQQYASSLNDGLADLDTRLNEMNHMQSISGTCIMPIKGHFR